MKRTRIESSSEIHEPKLSDWMENDALNPMLNTVVVERLFKMIPFEYEEFTNFRLVSKLFWKSSLPAWRRNVWLSVNGRTYRSNNSCPNIEGYLDMHGTPGDPYQLSKNFGFHKLKVDNWEFNLGGGGRVNRKKMELLSNVGDKITHLKCCNSDFHTREDFERLIFDLIPNLQFLSLSSNTYRCGILRGPEGQNYRNVPPVWNEDMRPSPQTTREKLTHVEISLEWKPGKNTDFPLCWLNFFSRFPNAKVLKLQNLCPTMPDHSYTELIKLFQCLEMLREKCSPHILAQLEELDILTLRLRANEEIPDNLVEHLHRFAFPLKSLSVDIGFVDIENETVFKEILEMHSSTLEKLVVYQAPLECLIRMRHGFPFGVSLPNLKELILMGDFCANLNFLEVTQNLKTLVLMDGKNPKDNVMGMLNDTEDFSLRYLHQKQVHDLRVNPRGTSHFPLKDLFEMSNLTLQNLEVFIASNYLCADDLVAKMTRIMPNLKKLGVGLNNRRFRIACQTWKELEALSINPFEVEEFAFLGGGIRDRETQRVPSITDLTRLKYLSIGDNCYKKGLSNQSVLKGILALPNLKEVSFKHIPDGSGRMTPEVHEMLISKFPRLRNQIRSDDDDDASEDSSSESEMALYISDNETASESENDEEDDA